MMPLELKTGRPTYSVEHKGQVGVLNAICNSSDFSRVPTAPGKPGKMVTVFPAWKNPGILSFLPNILEK